MSKVIRCMFITKVWFYCTTEEIELCLNQEPAWSAKLPQPNAVIATHDHHSVGLVDLKLGQLCDKPYH
ncbi:uncharacterized protein PHALS_14547 [Plasmopara halstedii]|uniref:Uncharacterized protein n=1 Tax=Plasmopara halstedii TaxID=4781 RepID=A0A0N7L5J4_PLAHL|nr:uncharacterized protein PHALS_14547 [Plasmopara halstedii]CEG41643.1 hypothetical protein PHALS_14547 [Plasmopara halstedii]|eukprot:XP_024578012.1 hypothetical protein PHALS_14547 [Plasmopara halstedii]